MTTFKIPITMKTLKSTCLLLIVIAAFLNPLRAGDTPVWPLDKYTKVIGIKVIYVSQMIGTGRVPAAPERVKNDYTHSFTTRMLMDNDSMSKKCMALIAEATLIPHMDADFRWGITITLNDDATQDFFIAYRGDDAIAKLGKNYFKLDLEKTKTFLSQFNDLFGSMIK